MFYQLIYMSAIAAAGISRSRIFQLSAKIARAPGEYFKRIHLLCEKLGYNYPSACTVVGQRTKSEAMKTLLLRFADALSSGHPEVAFLEEESEVQRDAYEKEYDRNLASLQKWTDAYAAIVVSAALIVIVNLTSTMIYDLGTSMVFGLIITAVLTSAGGAWVISRAAPAEPEAFFTPEGPPSQRLFLKLVKIVPLVDLIACALMALLKIDLGWIVMIASAIMFPLGIVVVRATGEIDKKDKEIGPFLRSFGAVAMSTGTTLSEALNRIDLASFPNLQPDMNRLRWRFKAAIDPELCWTKFALETGSKLIGETISIFHDATRLGGDADTVGSLSSRFATTEVMLRARREVIASTFSGLSIVMHAVISALMIIILEVIRNFTEVIEAAASFEGQDTMTSMGLPMLSFGSPILQMLGTLTVAMVILLAFVNGFAIVAADGGHLFKMLFHLPILVFISGLCLIVVPPLVDAILKVG